MFSLWFMMPDQKTKFNPKTNFYKEDTCNLNSLEAKGLLQNQRTSSWGRAQVQLGMFKFPKSEAVATGCNFLACNTDLFQGSKRLQCSLMFGQISYNHNLFFIGNQFLKNFTEDRPMQCSSLCSMFWSFIGWHRSKAALNKFVQSRMSRSITFWRKGLLLEICWTVEPFWFKFFLSNLPVWAATAKKITYILKKIVNSAFDWSSITCLEDLS